MESAEPRSNRRDEIVAAAGELFSARGYHGTSMRDLAKRLELRGSSLYAHFDSKDDVLWAIVASAAAAFVAAADGVPRELAPTARLEGLVAGHLRVIRGELPYATVFFQDWIHLSDKRRGLLVAMRDDYQRRFHEVIAAGVELREFAVEDVALATLVVLSALNFSHQWLKPSGRLGHDELATAFTAQLLNGLRGPLHDAESPREAENPQPTLARAVLAGTRS
ncbi:MAG TPA: TetR/AcrR family transcriptional regulator [Trueperaceae bacterium]|nr:TetR/AcrR family transcriptional regulator [Trueperaceae bacterium]